MGCGLLQLALGTGVHKGQINRIEETTSDVTDNVLAIEGSPSTQTGNAYFNQNRPDQSGTKATMMLTKSPAKRSLRSGTFSWPPVTSTWVLTGGLAFMLVVEFPEPTAGGRRAHDLGRGAGHVARHLLVRGLTEGIG